MQSANHQLRAAARNLPVNADAQEIEPRTCPNALALRIDERRTIGRELHDSTSQLLVALQLNVGCLKERLGGSDHSELLARIDCLLADLHREVRAAAAIVPETPFRGSGLVAALSEMAANFSRLTGVQVTVLAGSNCPFAANIEAALYRIGQEALANAVRHGRARHITIRIRFDRPGPTMTVDDDGIGIDPKASAGVGLCNIRERAAEIGGLLSIQRLSRGTRIAVSVPRSASA